MNFSARPEIECDHEKEERIEHAIEREIARKHKIIRPAAQCRAQEGDRGKNPDQIASELALRRQRHGPADLRDRNDPASERGPSGLHHSRTPRHERRPHGRPPLRIGRPSGVPE